MNSFEMTGQQVNAADRSGAPAISDWCAATMKKKASASDDGLIQLRELAREIVLVNGDKSPRPRQIEILEGLFSSHADISQVFIDGMLHNTTTDQRIQSILPWGVMTGRPVYDHFFFVIDIDYKHAIDKIIDIVPEDTFIVETLRGWHIYLVSDYMHCPPPQALFWRGERIGDVKSSNGYVIAPPSIISGWQYKLTSGEDIKRIDPYSLDELGISYTTIENINKQYRVNKPQYLKTWYITDEVSESRRTIKIKYRPAPQVVGSDVYMPTSVKAQQQASSKTIIGKHAHTPTCPAGTIEPVVVEITQDPRVDRWVFEFINGIHKQYKSRSEADFALIMGLISRGFSKGEIKYIYKISKHNKKHDPGSRSFDKLIDAEINRAERKRKKPERQRPMATMKRQWEKYSDVIRALLTIATCRTADGETSRDSFTRRHHSLTPMFATIARSILLGSDPSFIKIPLSKIEKHISCSRPTAVNAKRKIIELGLAREIERKLPLRGMNPKTAFDLVRSPSIISLEIDKILGLAKKLESKVCPIKKNQVSQLDDAIELIDQLITLGAAFRGTDIRRSTNYYYHASGKQVFESNEHERFAKAAEALHVSVRTLRRQMKRLREAASKSGTVEDNLVNTAKDRIPLVQQRIRLRERLSLLSLTALAKRMLPKHLLYDVRFYSAQLILGPYGAPRYKYIEIPIVA